MTFAFLVLHPISLTDANVKQRLAQDRTVLVSLGDHRKPRLEMLIGSGTEVLQVACRNEKKRELII